MLLIWISVTLVSNKINIRYKNSFLNSQLLLYESELATSLLEQILNLQVFTAAPLNVIQMAYVFIR